MENKQEINRLCEEILIKELNILSLTTNGDTLENKACKRIEAVANVLKAING